MKGLYKGKYLIAVYDKEGYLLDVACSPSELTCFDKRDKKQVAQYISHIANGTTISNRIFLIDATEKHKDIFAEEDKLFLQHIKTTRKKKDIELAKELNMSKWVYSRKKKLFVSNCHEIMIQ